MPSVRASAVLLVLMLTAVSPARAEPGTTGRPLEKVRLQLKWKHQFQFAGYYAAIEKGYYRDVGLEVELIEAPDAAEPADAVFDGEAEFGIAASDLILLRSKGRPVVALAAIYQHSPLIFLARADREIGSIHDLKGKRVMIEPHAAELIAYLQFEGLGLTQLSTVPHTFSPDDLIAGKVDAISAYLTDEPFLLRRGGIDYFIFTPRSAGIDFYGDTLFTTEEMLRKKPRLVRRFVDASLRGWRYALKHSDEIIDLILTRYSKRHSREHLAYEARMTKRLVLPDVVELGYMNPGRWRHIANIYAQMGMMPPGLSLDGFLHDRRPRPDLRWVGYSLVAAAFVMLVALLLTMRFYRLGCTIRKQSEDLRQTEEQIKTLHGVLPICAHCKRIRDDKGAWFQLERYISDHSEAMFSHGICEDCVREHYEEERTEGESSDGRPDRQPG